MRVVGTRIPTTGEDRKFYSTADSTATAGQTVFAVNYDEGKVAVWLNGIRLVQGQDFTYTASGVGSQITLSSGIVANDYVEVVGYQGIYSGNALVEDRFVVGTSSTGSGGSYTNSTTVFPVASNTGDLVCVYRNGIKLVHTTDFTVNASASTVTLQSASNTADEITVHVIGILQHSNFVQATGGTFTGDVVFNSTGAVTVPVGTTAQRPGSPSAGDTRLNSDSGSLEFYDGANWISTNLIPTINSITGNIYATVSSTLTLSATNATDTIDVKYYEGVTLLATDSGVTVTNGSATSTVPSAVYGQTVGDTISIQVFNQDGTPSSNSIDKTVIGLPSGGTITGPTGGYYYHTFTTSDATGFVNTITNLSVDYIIVAGGGSGGKTDAGGGGAGGAINSSTTLSTTNYPITIGGGGPTKSTPTWTRGNNGSDSTAFSQTAIGGGGGGSGVTADATNRVAQSGGSGGGAGSTWTSTVYRGSGTSGQGNNGGVGNSGQGGGGGGGKTSVGGNGPNGTGGTGINWNGYLLAGGGNGGHGNTLSTTSYGGGSGQASGNGGPATANTGSGGGGGGGGHGNGGSGGSGIVIIRYQLP